MSSRSRSRSPLGSPEYESKSKSWSKHSVSSDFDTSVLHLYNIPKYWTYDDVKNFIREKNRTLSFGLKFVKIISKNNAKIGECLIKFSNAGVCKKGFDLLNGMETPNGSLIRAVPSSESVYKPPKQENIAHSADNRNINELNQQQFSSSSALKNAINKIKLHIENMKPSGSLQTYGLSINFLDALGIKPPLLDKIFIANLDSSITEEKIREVFGHAGQIISVQLSKKSEKKPSMWAKVEYDHPVEAVQAISMLHDKELFGKKLIVQMDSNPRLFQKHIPEGLSEFGPGLGENGSVLKGVRTTVELQLLKNVSADQQNNKSDQNQNANQDSLNQQLLQVDPMAMMNIQSNIPTMNNIIPVQQNAALLGLQSLINPQMHQGLFHAGGTTELATALAALQSQTMATSMPIIAQNVPIMGQNQSDWSQSQSLYNKQNQEADTSDGQYQTGYGKKMNSHDSRSNRHEADNQPQRRSEDRSSSNNTESDMLVFNNLPASVTLAALNNKMREVGEVKFAEITSKGRAIVRFYSPRDAERCVNLFDRSRVDGQTIDVRFF